MGTKQRKHPKVRLSAAVSTPVPPKAAGGATQRNLLLLVAVLLFGYYGIALKWSVDEFAHFLLGVIFLWGPIGAFLYVALCRSIVDPMVRLALSCAGSYTLTTLLYFAAAVLRVDWLFGGGLIGATATAVWLGRRPQNKVSLSLPRLDSILLVIVAGSLVTTIPYSSLITLQPSGNRLVTGFPDHFYHIGLEYELNRHVPPSQATILGGTPERAYHNFPHLTVMLLARFTGQSDMLRSHSVYHYAVVTVLICLTMYGLGFLLTASTTGGYVCAFLPFLFAIATRPIMPNTIGYFFFTALPHATSSVYPTLFTSPQMYSGVAVLYGVALGIAALLQVRGLDRADWGLLVLCSLMIASLLRFRVHCWIAAFPSFLVLVVVVFRRSRNPGWLIAGAIAIVASALLYAEMFLPVYMRGTAHVQFALNYLSNVPFYKIWPFSATVEGLLHRLLTGSQFNYIWQVVCLVGFAVWDMLGIPLCITLVLVPLIMKHGVGRSYYVFTMGLIALSIVFATCVSAGYDGYSIPGQVLYHIGWYALPLEGIGIAWLVSYLRRHTNYAPVVLLIVGTISGFASVISQREVLPSLAAIDGVITRLAGMRFVM